MKRVIFILVLFVLTGCSSNYVLVEDGIFDSVVCLEKGLNDTYIMAGSKYCEHCLNTAPIFEAACEELNLTPLVLDLSKKEDYVYLDEKGIAIKYTPTFILNCSYYLGEKTKEEYLEILK